MTTEEFEHEAGLLRPMLVATAARMLGSDSRAEDAAQETLAKLWDASDDVLEHVMAVVGRLPAAQQIVLRLRHIDGMATADIARLTGASEASVRKTLSRARMAVRKHYIEGTEDEQ